MQWSAVKGRHGSLLCIACIIGDASNSVCMGVCSLLSITKRIGSARVDEVQLSPIWWKTIPYPVYCEFLIRACSAVRFISLGITCYNMCRSITQSHVAAWKHWRSTPKGSKGKGQPARPLQQNATYSVRYRIPHPTWLAVRSLRPVLAKPKPPPLSCRPHSWACRVIRRASRTSVQVLAACRCRTPCSS